MKDRELANMQECLRDYVNYSSRQVEGVNTGYPVRKCFGRLWQWRIDLKDYGATVVRAPVFCRFPDLEDEKLASFQEGCTGGH